MQTNSIYDYKEHYQQQQEMQQYGYPLASHSSGQLTLPLSRGICHSSSVVSPLQTSFVVQSGNRELCSTLLGLEPDLSSYDRQRRSGSGSGSNRSSTTGGRSRKHRKHERSKHQKLARRANKHPDELPAPCDLVERDFPAPESFKISYPHYYEDGIGEYALGEGARDHAEPGQKAALPRGGKSQSGKRHGGSNGAGEPAPQYTEMHFRDVGREIDV